MATDIFGASGGREFEEDEVQNPQVASSSRLHRRLQPEKHQTNPLSKRMGVSEFALSPPLEFIEPIGQSHQFKFTRPVSIAPSSPSDTERSFEITSVEGTESQHEVNEGLNRSVRQVETDKLVSEELDNGFDDGSGIKIVRSGHYEDAKSDASEQHSDGWATWLRELGEEQDHRYRQKKERRRAGLFKRSYRQSVEDKSSCSGDGLLDDDLLDDVHPAARRLRGRVREPFDRRGSLIFEDRGFLNPDYIIGVEKSKEGKVTRSKGPPSIHSDDAFTSYEPPWWKGSREVEIESDRNNPVNSALNDVEHLDEIFDNKHADVEERPLNEKAFDDLTPGVQQSATMEVFSKGLADCERLTQTRVVGVSWPEALVPGSLDDWLEDLKDTLDALFHERQTALLAKRILFLALGGVFLLTDNALITTGLLEPTLQIGFIRIRWHCVCGDPLYSDVQELRQDGVTELIEHMRTTSSTRASATSHNQHATNQRYVIPNPGKWLRNCLTTIASVFTGSSKQATSLPQHNMSSSTTSGSSMPPNAPPQATLHLLACMHRDQTRKVLRQDALQNVPTDRMLVRFLQRQYTRHRGRFLHKISLKRVKRISFVKFRLPIGGLVDTRLHDPWCTTNPTAVTGCECLPPPTLVEPSPTAQYRCKPVPPATSPPIAPEYLASLFTCPTDVHEHDDWILKQLPKRTCGELQGKIGQPAEGWGIYYQEGWGRDLIVLAIFVVFLIASLLFGVLWSRFQMDVQGAFGVSAYMVTASAVLISLIVTRAEKWG